MAGQEEQEREPGRGEHRSDTQLSAAGPRGAHVIATLVAGLTLLLVAVWRCG